MIGRAFMIASLAAVVAVGRCDITVAATVRVPDDYQTIQHALDAATSGDTVLVGPGTYHERIRIKAGVTLKSDGNDSPGELGLQRSEATIIDGGGEPGEIAGVTMAQGATLDGFTVTNVGRYDDAQWQKHHATQGQQQLHEHIGQPGTAGISVIGVTCTISNNIVHHIGYTGIAIQGGNETRCAPYVYRNICYRNMGGGIGSMHKSTAVIQQNICFQNFYAGIGHDDASPSVIANVCYENIRAGIGISEGACPIVRGNKCYKNRRAGIGTRSGSGTRPTIENNECYQNDMAGIGAEEDSAPMIRNNRCYQNKLAGIGSRTRAKPIIIGNECYENVEAGIGQEGDSVTLLVGNHCHHNQAAGIGFAECDAGHSTVIDNRVIDNAKVAVGIHSGWTVHLSGNELSRRDGLPPIVMVFVGAEATLTDNRIRGGGVAGIRTAGKVRAEKNEIAGSAMRPTGPPNFAIWALPGSEITMTGNTIHGWRHGLWATESNVSVTKNTVSDFHNAAFVISDSKLAADVLGNVAICKDPDAQVVSLRGQRGVVSDNQRLDERLDEAGE